MDIESPYPVSIVQIKATRLKVSCCLVIAGRQID